MAKNRNSEGTMLTIRIPKTEWAKAWRARIEIAPVRLVGDEPTYEVVPAHLQVLNERGFHFEVVDSQARGPEKRRHGTAN
jgi:hypothetical protein